MEKSHQQNQADYYEKQSAIFDERCETKQRTYGLKAKFAGDIIRARGLAAGELLEVGGGTGLGTQKLAEALPELRIHTTDIFSPMLDIAKQRLRRYPNVTCDLYAAPAATGPVGKLYDVVFGIDVIHHIEEPTEALAEWRRWVKPGGVALFLEANMLNPAMWWRHRNMPCEARAFLNNPKNFSAWFGAAGWRNIEVKTMPAYLPSGPQCVSKLFTKIEELTHRIPLVNKLSAQFLVYAENPS